jgi:hypothetical protein
MHRRSRDKDGPGFDSRHGKFFLHRVQIGSEAHTEVISPGLERLGRESDDSPPSNTEVKNSGAIPPLLHKSSWHSA